MRALFLSKRLIDEIYGARRNIISHGATTTSLLLRTLTSLGSPPPKNFAERSSDSLKRRCLDAPWAALHRRGYKVLGTDVRAGDVIERKGRKYEVVKVHHVTQGRGGATIQAEMRDIENGSKVNLRLRTDEALEGILVEGKEMTCLYTENEIVYLMDPKTFDQFEVSKELFGKNAGYLTDEMTVNVRFYDGKPMSATVPTQVTCTVVQTHERGKDSVQAQYKRVVLDNGLTMQVPEFIAVGDRVVISTTQDTYLTRTRE